MLHQLMFQLKLPGMDAQKKEAKQRYQEALGAYVTQYFGRPLEKLNVRCKCCIFVKNCCSWFSCCIMILLDLAYGIIQNITVFVL